MRLQITGLNWLAQGLVEALVNGDGIRDFRFGSWHGGLELDRAAIWINVFLSTEQLSVLEKNSLKAAAVLFASVLWDNDFIPLFDGSGVNLGTPNMPAQESEYRNLYALALAHHPDMKDRANTALSTATASLNAEINSSGAHRASPHYVGASFEPLLDVVLQIKLATN